MEKMTNKRFLSAILAIALVLGMTAVGCDNGSTGGGGGGSGSLPKANGVNAVSGKTYYYNTDDGDQITFSVTTGSATSGTYVVNTAANGTYSTGSTSAVFTYKEVESGSYTWNEAKNTITLKLEKFVEIPSHETETTNSGSGSSAITTTTIRGTYGTMMDKTAYRTYVQNGINSQKQQMGEAAFNQALSDLGFSSASDYIDYLVNGLFANRTMAYSFSADGTALFLEEELPANKGTNELSGQTYYHYNDTNRKYVFTDSGYTYTQYPNSTYGTTVTGTYAYDGSRKTVYLKPSTVNGKTRAEYYADQTASRNQHFLVDNDAARAAKTNGTFRLYYTNYPYNSVNKTIGRRN